MLALTRIRKMTETVEKLLDTFSNRYGAGHEYTLEVTSLWIMANVVLDDIERISEEVVGE